jgi:hypothetical protein
LGFCCLFDSVFVLTDFLTVFSLPTFFQKILPSVFTLTFFAFFEILLFLPFLSNLAILFLGLHLVVELIPHRYKHDGYGCPLVKGDFVFEDINAEQDSQ